MAKAGNLNQNRDILPLVDTTEEELNEFLTDSKSKNTNRLTKTALNKFKSYLKLLGLSELDLIEVDQLLEILTKIYTDVRTNSKGELFMTGSFKVLRAGLNRYFKVEKNIDIVNDKQFLRANLVFDGVRVKAKKSGKGITKSSPLISKEDLKMIGIYFNIDHMKKPVPKILQQTIHSGGSRGAPPPSGQILLDFMQFSGTLIKFYPGAPLPEGWRPPLWKSWIRHWYSSS